MDESVKLALAKWPNVPDCFGWLALDARGRWRIGPPREAISNASMIDFINRNYLCDESGRWFFQNGPQRVFVELDLTPFVWRFVPKENSVDLVAHTGYVAVVPSAVCLADDGRFLIEADGRIGALHDHDSALLVEGLCGAQGQALNDEQKTAAIAQLLALDHTDDAKRPIAACVSLPGASKLLVVTSIALAQIATQFRFDPHPAPA